MKMYLLLILLVVSGFARAGIISKLNGTPVLNEKEKRYYSATISDRTTEQYSFVTIDKKTFDDNSINIWLFDWTCDFTIQSRQLNKNGTTTIVAKPVNKEGYALFTVQDDGVYAQILIASQYYDIRSVGVNKFVLRKYDQRKYPKESCEFSGPTNTGKIDQSSAFVKKEKVIGSQFSGNREETGSDDELEPEIKDDCELRIAVFYSLDVWNNVMYPQVFAQQCVDQLNLSFTNSLISHTAVLAYSGIEIYADQGVMENDLDAFFNPTDGDMDDVPAIRDKFSGDFCILLTTTEFNAGGAHIAGQSKALFTNAANAFAIVNWTAAIANITFSHEIGHLLGSRHNTDGATVPFAKGHGHTNVPNGWRTIMGDNNGGCCVRIPYWTNPSVSFLGNPTSPSSTFQDEATVLNATITDARTFRQPPGLVNLSTIYFDINFDTYGEVQAVDQIVADHFAIYNLSNNIYMKAGRVITFENGFVSNSFLQAEIYPVYHCSGDPTAGGGFVSEGGGGDDGLERKSNASISDHENSKDIFTAYPNPTANYLNITWRSENQENLMMKVFDLNGKLVYNWTAQQGTNLYNVSELAAGMYTVRAVLSNGKVLSEHFIKQSK